MSFDITSSQKSIISSNFNSPFCESRDPEKLNVNYVFDDTIYQHLIEHQKIDENLTVQPEYRGKITSFLTTNASQKLNRQLEEEIIIQSKDHLFSISFCLKELFLFLNVDKIEMIGGTVYSILGKEVMIKLIETLKIPKELIEIHSLNEFEKQANDVDVRIHVSDPDEFEKKMIEFIHQKISKDVQKQKSLFIQLESEAERLNLENNDTNHEKNKSSLKNLYTKYIKTHFFIHFLNSKPLCNGEIWSQISFEGPTKFDLTFSKKQNRSHLFTHNDLQITISYFGKNFETHQMTSHIHQIETVLLHRFLKVIHAFKPDEINPKGACMLFSYLSKGWRYFSRDFENALIDTLKNNLRPNDFLKTIKNHFPNNSHAPLIYFFNSCQLLLKGDFKKIFEQAQILLLKNEVSVTDETKEETLFKSFSKSLKTLANPELNFESFKKTFNLIQSFYELIGNLSDSFHHVHPSFDIHQLHLIDKPYLKITFKNQDNLSIFVENQGKNLKEIFKETFEPSFRDHHIKTLNVLTESLPLFLNHLKAKLEIKSHPFKIDVELAIQLLKSDVNSKELLGFYLLLYNNYEKTSLNDFPLLLSHFLKLLEEPFSLKQKDHLIASFGNYLKIHEGSSLKNCDNVIQQLQTLLKKEQKNSIAFKKAVYFEMLNLSNEVVFNLIYALWKKDEKLFNIKETQEFSLYFKETNPEIALDIFNRTLSSDTKIESSTISTFLKMIKHFNASKSIKSSFLLSEKILSVSLRLFDQSETSKVLIKMSEIKPLVDITIELIKTEQNDSLLLLSLLEKKNFIPKGFCSIVKEFKNLNHKILFLFEMFFYQKNRNLLTEEQIFSFYKEVSEIHPKSLENETSLQWMILLKEIFRELLNLPTHLKNEHKNQILKNFELTSSYLLKEPTLTLSDRLKNHLAIAIKIDFYTYTERSTYLEFLMFLDLLIPETEDIQILKDTYLSIKRFSLKDASKQDSKAIIETSNKIFTKTSLKILNKEDLYTLDPHLVFSILKDLISKKTVLNQIQHKQFIEILFKTSNHFFLSHQMNLSLNLITLIENNLKDIEIFSPMKNFWKTYFQKEQISNEKEKIQLLIQNAPYLKNDEEFLSYVEEFINKLLSQNQSQNKHSIQKIVDLISAYEIKSFNISLLVKHLETIKNNQLNCICYQKVSSFLDLKQSLPIILLINTFPLDLIISLKTEINTLLELTENKNNQAEFLFLFSKSLFQEKNELNSDLIFKSLNLIYNYSNERNLFSEIQKKEIYLKHLESFMHSTEFDSIVLGWRIVEFLSFKNLTDLEMNIISSYILYQTIFLDYEKRLFPEIGHIYCQSINRLKLNFSKSNLIKFLSDFSQLIFTGSRLLTTAKIFTKQVIEKLPQNKSEQVDNKLKSLIEKLIDMCIDSLSDDDLADFITPKLFSEKEMMLHCKKGIWSILDHQKRGLQNNIHSHLSCISLYIKAFKNPTLNDAFMNECFVPILNSLFMIFYDYKSEYDYLSKLKEIIESLLSITGPIKFLKDHHVLKIPERYDYLSFVPINEPSINQKNVHYILARKYDLFMILDFLNCRWAKILKETVPSEIEINHIRLCLSHFDFQMALYSNILTNIKQFCSDLNSIQCLRTGFFKSIHQFSGAISSLPLPIYVELHRELKLRTLKEIVKTYQLVYNMDTPEQLKLAVQLFSMFNAPHSIFSSVNENSRFIWMIESLKESWNESNLNSTAITYHNLKRYKKDPIFDSKKGQTLLSLIESQIKEKTLKNFGDLIENDPLLFLEKTIEPYKDILDIKIRFDFE